MSVYRPSPKRAAVLALFIWCGQAAAEPVETRPSSDAVEQAKSAYDRGVDAYKQGRFRDAIESFSVADRLAPRAALSFNIARAYDRLNETGPALAFYREYLRRGAEAGNRAGVERRVRELAALLATKGLQQLTVLSRPAGATLSIDGRNFGVTPVTLELAPGVHRIALTRVGYTETTGSIELSRGDPLLVDVELTAPQASATRAAEAAPMTSAAGPSATLVTAPASAPSGAVPPEATTERSLWPAWALFGASGIAFASAGVLEILRHDAASDASSPDTSQVRFTEQSSAAKTYQTGARVMLGVGSVLALGGAAFWFGLGRKPAPRATAALGCSPAGCSGGIRMTY